MTDTQITELNVISLNCWGLKFISKYRSERLAEIGRQIASAIPLPHIVGLQECWTQADYQRIRKETKHILPFGKFYFSGVLGAGLAILSKWPIERSSMIQYPLNGRPTAFWRGDWYVGKGIASAMVRIGPGAKNIVQIFTTHLHAPYDSDKADSYLCHRTAQAWEIAKLMRNGVEQGHLVLAMGDFNMLPNSLAHMLVTSHSPVVDVWEVGHSISSSQPPHQAIELVLGSSNSTPTAEFNLKQNGVTCDSAFNTWRWNKGQQKRLGPNRPHIEVPPETPDGRAKRLDYVFMGNRAGMDKSSEWTVTRAEVGMTQRHPLLQCSLSDHFSVETTLSRSRVVQRTDGSNEDYIPATTSETHPATSAGGNRELEWMSYLPISIYDEILAMIAQYILRERKQRRYRLYHFVVSVLVWVGCLVGVWWSPRNFVSFILLLLGSLGLTTGTIDALIGYLFMSAEIAALKEFNWEIQNARVAAGGAHPSPDTNFEDY